MTDIHVPTHWFSATLIVAAFASIAVAGLTLRLAAFPGRRSFLLLQAAAVWWCIAVAFEHWADLSESKRFWAETAWLGIIATPIAWVLFIWNYIFGLSRPVSPKILWALAIFVALTWGTALTNDSHHLFYSSIVPTGSPPYMINKYTHGPAFYVANAIGTAILVVGELSIVYAILHANVFYRVHYYGLLITSLIPWGANVLHNAGYDLVPNLDQTPHCFVILNMILYWLIRRYHLFDLIPIAHNMLFDAIPFPVLVLDAESRIVECNPASQSLSENRALSKNRVQIGASLKDIPDLHHALSELSPETKAPQEIFMSDPPRHFDVVQVPLSYDEHTIGHLVLMQDIDHRKEIEARLQTAHDDLQVQLQNNISLQLQLREEAIRDTLTGLYNRRFFDELAPVLLADADRSGSTLAAVMVDIDHFKQLNDRHGHLAGDDVLRATGVFLRQNVRQSDVVIRMGGEEFLILFPHTQEEQSFERIETIRDNFARQSIEYDGILINATFSAGMALYPVDAHSMNDLLRLADTALYQAKNSGRNRCCRWTPG